MRSLDRFVSFCFVLFRFVSFRSITEKCSGGLTIPLLRPFRRCLPYGSPHQNVNLHQAAMSAAWIPACANKSRLTLDGLQTANPHDFYNAAPRRIRMSHQTSVLFNPKR
jgi:hypothetical protein